MNIAILLPTVYRPGGLARTLNSLINTAPEMDVIIAGERDDYMGQITASEYNIMEWAECRKPLQGPAYAWNTALEYSELLGRNYQAYFLASDDIEFLPGWYDETMKVLQNELNGSGLVGLNDMKGKFERAGFVTQYLMTRDFIINHNGGVAACPHYQCDFTDLEATERAKRANKFAYASKAFINHHWRAVDDDSYQRADTKREAMKALYLRRKEQNFPDDYERIIHEDRKQPA